MASKLKPKASRLLGEGISTVCNGQIKPTLEIITFKWTEKLLHDNDHLQKLFRPGKAKPADREITFGDVDGSQTPSEEESILAGEMHPYIRFALSPIVQHTIIIAEEGNSPLTIKDSVSV